MLEFGGCLKLTPKPKLPNLSPFYSGYWLFIFVNKALNLRNFLWWIKHMNYICGLTWSSKTILTISEDESKHFGKITTLFSRFSSFWALQNFYLQAFPYLKHKLCESLCDHIIWYYFLLFTIELSINCCFN
jgi:hypothetical protein